MGRLPRRRRGERPARGARFRAARRRRVRSACRAVIEPAGESAGGRRALHRRRARRRGAHRRQRAGLRGLRAAPGSRPARDGCVHRARGLRGLRRPRGVLPAWSRSGGRGRLGVRRLRGAAVRRVRGRERVLRRAGLASPGVPRLRAPGRARLPRVRVRLGQPVVRLGGAGPGHGAVRRARARRRRGGLEPGQGHQHGLGHRDASGGHRVDRHGRVLRVRGRDLSRLRGRPRPPLYRRCGVLRRGSRGRRDRSRQRGLPGLRRVHSLHRA